MVSAYLMLCIILVTILKGPECVPGGEKAASKMMIVKQCCYSGHTGLLGRRPLIHTSSPFSQHRSDGCVQFG